MSAFNAFLNVFNQWGYMKQNAIVGIMLMGGCSLYSITVKKLVWEQYLPYSHPYLEWCDRILASLFFASIVITLKYSDYKMVTVHSVLKALIMPSILLIIYIAFSFELIHVFQKYEKIYKARE